MAKRIAGLESKWGVREVSIGYLVTEYHGGEAELASLRASFALLGVLTPLAKTDAILSVPRAKGSSRSHTEIVMRLNAAGRSNGRRRSPLTTC